MGLSMDHIPSGSRTTDARSAEEHGSQPAPSDRHGTQPPPQSDVRLKRKVRSLASEYGTQPPPTSDLRLKRELRAR